MTLQLIDAALTAGALTWWVTAGALATHRIRRHRTPRDVKRMTHNGASEARRFILARLSTRRCHGCTDPSFHTHHLTWLGRRRFTR